MCTGSHVIAKVAQLISSHLSVCSIKGYLGPKNISVVCVLKTKVVYSCFIFTVQKLMRNKVQ